MSARYDERFVWTPDRIARLRRLFELNLNDTIVAERFGTTSFVIRNQRRGLGLVRSRSSKHWTTLDLAKLIAMKSAGKTRVEIAAALGCTKKSVVHKITALRKAGRLPKIERANHFVKENAPPCPTR